MENKRRKKKLILKIAIIIALALMFALFCVVIAQTVRISKLNNEIEKINQTYHSQTTEEEWKEQ